MRKKDSFVRKFAEKNLILTQHVKKKTLLYKLNNYAETFVVGSDQVFRDHCMSKYFDEFLLPYTDFSKKRVAFSASFGKDNFEASDKEKDFYSKYLKRFDAISVRETSGVDLCQEEFGVKAIQLLDPVFLVDKNKFLKFIDYNNTKYEEKIVCIILDDSSDTRCAIKNLEKTSGLKAVSIIGKNLPVEEFLTAIYSAKYLITDSFHGTCFALLFHKTFFTIKNENRGSARFDSLINIFGLKNCYVKSPSEINLDNLNKDIDWAAIDNIIDREKERAEVWFEKVFNGCCIKTNEMLANEFDILKYPKQANKFSFKNFLFSVKKDSLRIRIYILGIRISIRKKW